MRNSQLATLQFEIHILRFTIWSLRFDSNHLREFEESKAESKASICQLQVTCCSY